MKYKSWIITAVLGILYAQFASAVPTPEQVAQLGTTLTPMGAIKEGNADGTIPPWTGGLCKDPPPGMAGYKPKYEGGGGPYLAPYPDEKPLFRITGKNWEQYKDKIDLGTREFFKRFPDTWYMDIYPSHRTACAPDWVYKRTKERAMEPRLVGCPTCSMSNAQAQVPFPIPENGAEVMWNKKAYYSKPSTFSNYYTWYVDSAGNGARISEKQTHSRPYFWNRELEPDDSRPYNHMLSTAVFPRASVGTLDFNNDYAREDLYGHPVYSYIPGQRRVRLAPEFAYDGVPPSTGGTSLYDEGGGFLGKMDKFDFQLLGRQEIYVPYNVDSMAMTASEDVNGPDFIDPALHRWELHRTWVVKAVLREGERHVQKEKWFYVDEDSWKLMFMANFDQAGNLHHYSAFYATASYDDGMPATCNFTTYDWSKRAWAHWGFGQGNGWAFKKDGECNTPDYTNPPDNWFTPGGMTGIGVR